MNRQIEQEGKTTEEAIRKGLEVLGLTEADVSVEILETEQKGFLGIGSKPAKVRLTVTESEEEPEKPAEKAPKAAPEKREPKQEKTEAVREPSVIPPTERKSVGDESCVKTATEFLQMLFEKMDLEVKIDAAIEDGMVKMDLSGPEMGAVIGRRGETLDALQYLTTLAVNKKREEYCRVSLDTENYRSEREKTLQNLALRLAEKAKKSRRNVSLEPMNAYERKVIHYALQGDEMIHTYSVGEEPNRKIVISPKNAVRRNDSRRYSNR